ncbi:hypothetical protein BJ742DRAFT_18851 [Cladochytrium replicatum]|nr:hypothetical protein BJ742DRAFT_18851 [Cladochytrium replicatum]
MKSKKVGPFNSGYTRLRIIDSISAHRFPLDAIFESIATAILFTMEQRLSYSDRQYTRSPTHSTVHSPSDDTAPFFYLVAQIPVAANAFRRLSLELLSAWERRVREWSLATLNGWHTPPYSNGKQREAEITIPQLSPISVSFDTQVVSNRVNETSNGGTLSSGEISPPKNHYDQSFVNVSTSATGGGSLPKLSLTERLQQKIAAARMELKNSQSFDANVSI